MHAVSRHSQLHGRRRFCSQQPCIPSNTHRAATVKVHAAAQAETRAAADKVAAIKRDIIALSGTKYGHDLDEVTRQQVQSRVKQLEGLQLPVQVQLDKLTGTQWTTVYTTSTGTSSGKVGPFITQVIQDFPAAEPGVYYNESRLGLVCARLRGDYKVTRDDRVDLQFKNLVLRVGPFQAAEKVFGPTERRGYWKITYCDDDFRVFNTNMGNMFVLRKL
jgi:hypothetical protein